MIVTYFIAVELKSRKKLNISKKILKYYILPSIIYYLFGFLFIFYYVIHFLFKNLYKDLSNNIIEVVRQHINSLYDKEDSDAEYD